MGTEFSPKASTRRRDVAPNCLLEKMMASNKGADGTERAAADVVWASMENAEPLWHGERQLGCDQCPIKVILDKNDNIRAAGRMLCKKELELGFYGADPQKWLLHLNFDKLFAHTS